MRFDWHYSVKQWLTLRTFVNQLNLAKVKLIYVNLQEFERRKSKKEREREKHARASTSDHFIKSEGDGNFLKKEELEDYEPPPEVDDILNPVF